MGFGLCFLGFLALTLDSLGLDGVGFLLVALGFFKVSAELKDYKGYRLAAVFATTALPVALLSLYSFSTRFTGMPPLPDIVLKIKVCWLGLFSAAVCMAHCQSTARIAATGGSKLFALRANIIQYISALFYAGNIAGALFGASGGVVAVLLVLRYAVPLLNAWLLFTCFTTITTKARSVKEAELIKQQTEEIQRKKLLDRKKNGEGKQ